MHDTIVPGPIQHQFYIIFRNVEISQICFPKIFFHKENKESDEMCGNISFIEMEPSNLIN
jgi:hypothetical protein